MDLSYILNVLGEEREKYFNAIAPPVIQTSNFSFQTVDGLRNAFYAEEATHLYTRGNNPTVEILRKKLAALAGAEDALVFGSGAAAMTAAVFSQVKSGDHIVCVNHPYGWTEKLCRVILSRFGVETTFVDGRDVANYEIACRPNTKVFILESPNTFTFEIQDIRAIARLAKSRGLVSIIDNTYCTPLGQKVLEMGIDIEVHSASKYLNGHSDVVGGALISKTPELHQDFAWWANCIGNTGSPFDAYQTLRGLRTLEVRIRQQEATALKVARFFEQHQAVARVYYPGLTSHPGHLLACRQQHGFGAMISFELAGGEEQVRTFVEALQLFSLAESLGGVESLVAHPATMTHASMDDAARAKAGITDQLIRLSIGLEGAQDLLTDLSEALELVARSLPTPREVVAA